MNLEKSTIESGEKSKIKAEREAPIEIEKSPEEVEQKILADSEKEVDGFQKEGEDDLKIAEQKASVDGLQIYAEDKKELKGLNQEAEGAREELKKEITPPPLPEEYVKQYSKAPIPPPLPKEYAQQYSATPPPLPNMPPPIPSVDEKETEIKTSEKEPKYRSIEYYLQKSKIVDKNEALNKLIQYAGVNSMEDLKDKLKEKDENGDNSIEIDVFTPEILNTQKNPSIKLLKEMRRVGDALGYTFANTLGYQSQIEDLISKLKSNGENEKAIEVEKIFEEDNNIFEREKEKSEFREVDPELLYMDDNKEKQYIEKLKNLPPNGIIHLYHGLNGDYETALGVLDSPSHGVEQHSGPTFSFKPLGQFWKKGDLGFRYSLKRSQIEFPGEKNPDAVVKIGGKDGDVGYIENESMSLPFDQFNGEVMRAIGTYPDFEAEKKIQERLKLFAELREKNNK